MKKTAGKRQKTGAGQAGARKADTIIREKEYILYLVILAFAVLMLPHLLRFIDGNSSPIGVQPYYHARAAENLLHRNLGHDSLIYGGRDSVFVPYHLVLAAFGGILGMSMASKLLPFILGVISLIIFYAVLKQLKAGPMARFVISLLLIISPPYIYLFTVSTPACLTVFLSLLGIILFMGRRKGAFLGSIACFIIVSLSGVFNALLIMAILLFLAVMDNTKKKRAFIAAIMMFFVYLMHPVGFYYNFEVPVGNMLGTLASDLGAKAGFSIFGLILFVIGIFHLWKGKARYYPLYLAMLFMMASSLYIGEETNLYSNFIIVIFMAAGLQRLTSINWNFVVVRNLIFIIIGCGLFFSAASYMNRLPYMSPDSGMIGSLVWLDENSDPGQVVLTHYSRGYWVQSIAGRPVLLDSYSIVSPGYGRVYSDVQDIFYSIDLDETAHLLRKYNISYILIGNEMRQGLVWSRDKEGLLYLFRNNKTFKKAYANEVSEVWKLLVY